MWAESGVNPSRIASAQKPPSMTPDSDSPWPVSALVLLTPAVLPGGKTARRARASAMSPIRVEVACALT